MNPNITVFVCSTYSDLTDEREKVINSIQDLQLKHKSMEFFGAHSNQPIETCLAEVRRSNILVVIIGHKYGSIVPELGISFSEAEYNEAMRLKKPCLIYMRDENTPILPKNMERDPSKLQLLDKWKDKLQNRHTVSNFEESSDLAKKVENDINRTINDLKAAINIKTEAQLYEPIKIKEEVFKLIDNSINQGANEGLLISAIRRAIYNLISNTKHLGSRIFISYASSDIEIIKQIALGLKKKGMEVWFDENDIKDNNYIRRIEQELDTANVILFFISPDSVKDGWALKELQMALLRQMSGESGTIIQPVLLKQAEVPPLLRGIQWLDSTDGDVENIVNDIYMVVNNYNSPQLSEISLKKEGSRASGKKISYDKVISILEEERGIVGKVAKRLGVSSKRLYRLLDYYNIQPNEYK